MAVYTVGPSKDYANGAAWVADRPATLTEDWEGEFYQMDDTTQVVFSGVTPGAYYTKAYRVASEAHDGDPSVSGYQFIFTPTGNSQNGWNLGTEPNIEITGMVFETNDGGYTSARSIYVGDAATRKIEGNIVRGGTLSSTGSVGIYVNSATNYQLIGNNIIYGFNTASCNGIQILSTAGTPPCRVYRNVVDDCTSGIVIGTNDAILIDNIVQGGTTCYTGTRYAGSGNNLASDATGDIQSTLTFTNKASHIYSLASGDTAAIGAGTDLSADGVYALVTDVAGTAVNSPPDLGAFAYAASGSSSFLNTNYFWGNY